MRGFFLTFIVMLSSLGVLLAQGELGSHFLRGTWQATHSNPAFIPEGKLVIALPEFYDDIYISSITYDDLVVTDPDGNSYLDAGRAIPLLDDENIIREKYRIGTLGAGIRLGKVFLSLQHAIYDAAFLNYPRTLPQLIWQGNAQFVGQQVDVGFDVELSAMQEFAIGGAVELSDGLTVGGRLRLLFGSAELSTDRNALAITTDEEAYALTLDADFRTNSSGTITYDGFRDLQVDFNFSRFDVDRPFRKNFGFAVDLGAAYRVDRWTFAASTVNLGQLSWKDEVANYTIEGSYQFEGLKFTGNILADSTDFGNVLDTLAEIVEVVETNDSYTTRLPAGVFLSGTFQLNDYWRFGGLFYNEWYRGQTFPAAALAANYRPWGFLEVGATFAYRTGTIDNLGLNAVLRLGPVRLVASTDNIITAFQLEKSNAANFRAGVALSF